jgi:octaprenyl-diphosphate synthase
MGGALTSGELLQLHSGESMWISEKQYNLVIEQKTARLFAACSEAGAASTGATTRQMTAMRQYGLHLGMCFQLKDDILDYSDIEDIGKPTMNDIRDGKATLPLLISLQRANQEEANHIRDIAESLAAQSPHVDVFEAEQEIKSFVLRYEGIRYAHQEMEKHRKKALAALSIFPDNKYKEALVALLDYAITRMR